MSSRKETVAELSARLSQLGLSTAGRKVELQQRLEDHARQSEAQRTTADALPSASLKGLPIDIQLKIARSASRHPFYFTDQAKMYAALTRQTSPSVMEHILPTSLEWRVETGVMQHGTANMDSATLGATMAHVLAQPKLHLITMKRGHLTVRVVFGARLDVQILLFYPGTQAAAYVLALHGATRYDPATSRTSRAKAYEIVHMQLARVYKPTWTPQQASLEDAKKAVDDLALGLVWVKKHVMAKGMARSALLADQDMKFVMDDLSGDPMEQRRREGQDLKKHYFQQVARVLPKARGA